MSRLNPILMKYLTYSLFLICGSLGYVGAEEPIAAQYSFLVGKYECIGRWPDSDRTYSGHVEISEMKDGIKMIRTIDGKKVEAIGKYGTATSDKIQVLGISFKQYGVDFEETCMVDVDGENYARISCYVYSTKTKKVGLESLFSDHGQLRR